MWGEQVLLCRRAIEPRYGKWTLPAGFMEIGETTGDGAIRETLEEAGARIDLGPLFTMIDVPHVQQVHIFFRADLLDTAFSAGTESLEVRLFGEHEIPWEEIAFRTVAATLRHFFADRRRGEFGIAHRGHRRRLLRRSPAAASDDSVAGGGPALPARPRRPRRSERAARGEPANCRSTG